MLQRLETPQKVGVASNMISNDALLFTLLTMTLVVALSLLHLQL
jgi:hypothetical protein